MPDRPEQTAFVRRTDVMLRARFPHLTTRIFQVSGSGYVIVFPQQEQNAKEIAEEFDQSIRPVTVPVSLSNAVPEEFRQEISPILDGDISLGFEGYSFTAFDIINYLASRHPELPILLRIDNQNHPSLLLRFDKELKAHETETLRSVMATLMPGWPYEVASSDQDRMAIPSDPTDSIRIVARKLRSKAPAFVQRDEDFFWSEIDGIFQGRRLTFASDIMHDVGVSCYVDGSVFPNIDLRQLLLLYDTVFFTPPIEHASEGRFWGSQNLTKADLLQVIDAGRLRLVLKQPEERCDLRWLEEVSERVPDAIIGRLRAGTILAADLVSTANDYTFARPNVHQATVSLSRELASDLGVPEREILDLLLWPAGARRLAPQLILDRGLMAIPALGLGRCMGRQLERETGKDLALEAIAIADGVHIAHVLNATLIAPFDGLEAWQPARESVAQRLNFYRSFNCKVAAGWAINERRKESRKSLLPPVPLFTFAKHAPIEDILSFTQQDAVRFGGRTLVGRLSELPIDERAAEIDRLEGELYKQQIKRERRNLNLDTADAALGVANDLLSWGLWPVMSGLKLVQRIIALARRNSAFDAFADSLERDISGITGRNADIDFLDKINRVAVLTETRK